MVLAKNLSRRPAVNVNVPPLRWYQGKAVSKKLTRAQARHLIDRLRPSRWRDLRNRAVLALLAHRVVSVDDVIRMRITDYDQAAGAYWLRVKRDEDERIRFVPREVGQCLDEYLAATDIEHAPANPLFTSTEPSCVLVRSLSRSHVLRMLRRAEEQVAGRDQKKPEARTA